MRVKQGLFFMLALVAVLGLSVSSMGKPRKGKKTPPPPAPVEEVKAEPVWPSPLDPGKLDPVYQELPFGKDRQTFLTLLEQRLMEQLRPLLQATMDAPDRDRLKRSMRESFEQVKASWASFDGQASGYSISVISEEYKNNAGEGLLKYAYGDSVAYFFYQDDQLWKLYLCVETDGGFPEVMENLIRLYGPPTTAEFADAEKTSYLRATWKDTTFQLTASAPEGLFICSRLKWDFLPMVEKVEARRGKASENPEEGGASTGQSYLESVTGEEGSDNSNVMDEIIRKKKGQGNQ